jgi:hypothetical protein
MRHLPVTNMRFWPERNWRSLTRFFLLSALLLVVAVFTVSFLQLRHDAPAMAQALAQFTLARSFEALAHLEPSDDPRTIELHAAYFPSLLVQMSIITACSTSWEKNGKIPTAGDDLLRAGIRPADQMDPWGHPYRVRLLPGKFLIVQSTGPSGQDKIPPLTISEPKTFFQGGPKMFGDNFVLGLQLSDKTMASSVRKNPSTATSTRPHADQP